MVRSAWLFIDLEDAMRGGAAGMDDALGNALVIEMRDLLAHQDVFEQRRAAHVRLQRILVVADGHALVGRQHARRAPSCRGAGRAVLSVSCGGIGGLSLGVTWPEVRGGSGGSVLPGLAAMEIFGVGWAERSDGLASRLFARAVRLLAVCSACWCFLVLAVCGAHGNEATSLELLQQMSGGRAPRVGLHVRRARAD